MSAGQQRMGSVTILLPFEILGAAEDYGLILGRGLADRGWLVTLLLPDGLHLPVGTALNHPRLRTLRLRSGMGGPLSIRTVLRRLRPDIVHVNQMFLPGIAGGLLARSPVVVTAHTPALPVRYSRRGTFLLRWSAPQVAAWITLSPRNARLLRSRISLREPNRVATIPPGLPNERFDGQLTRDEARAVLHVPTEAFIVGSVGRLSPQKRPDILIRAAAELRRSIPNLRVVMFGDGELRHELESLAEHQAPGTVVFTGHMDDVVTLLRALDVFCLSSDFEGLPFALLEAMATGLPIVATDVQGSGEAVDDGVHGILVRPGSPPEIAAAVSRLAEDENLREKLGTHARERFRREFTADLMVERTAALYESVTEPHV